jgi:signal transduction histidine kinase
MSVATAIGTLAALAGWGVAAAALRELLRARRRLEAVADAEHELRGPATVLLLACERLRRDPSARRHVWALEAELQRMRRALRALTDARRGGESTAVGDVSVLEAARAADDVVSAPARPGWGAPAGRDLHDLVGGALAGWEPSLRAAGRPLRFRWDAGRVGLPEQRDAIASVLANLVANAAEHGAGAVRVQGTRASKAVRVEITNRSRRRSLAVPHRGRGLAIAQHAAREAGGALAVSEADGEFTAALELPLPPEEEES